MEGNSEMTLRRFIDDYLIPEIEDDIKDPQARLFLFDLIENAETKYLKDQKDTGI